MQFFSDFGQVFQKLWQCKFNLTTFDMGAFQIWSYHVNQDEKFVTFISKSYSPLTARKIHQIYGSAASILSFLPSEAL